MKEVSLEIHSIFQIIKVVYGRFLRYNICISEDSIILEIIIKQLNFKICFSFISIPKVNCVLFSTGMARCYKRFKLIFLTLIINKVGIFFKESNNRHSKHPLNNRCLSFFFHFLFFSGCAFDL